jgi:hypothetical protein
MNDWGLELEEYGIWVVPACPPVRLVLYWIVYGGLRRCGGRRKDRTVESPMMAVR